MNLSSTYHTVYSTSTDAQVVAALKRLLSSGVVFGLPDFLAVTWGYRP